MMMGTMSPDDLVYRLERKTCTDRATFLSYASVHWAYDVTAFAKF